MIERHRKRAQAMMPDDRRAAIVAATLPLITEHGATVTTGQIAVAAGVAEGTVFRAFTDKQELLTACLDAAFDPAGPVATLRQIPRELPLRDRLLRAAATVAEHWDRAITVGHAVRTSCAQPGSHGGPGHAMRELIGRVLAVNHVTIARRLVALARHLAEHKILGIQSLSRPRHR